MVVNMNIMTADFILFVYIFNLLKLGVKPATTCEDDVVTGIILPNGDSIPRYVNASEPSDNRFAWNIENDVKFEFYSKQNTGIPIIFSNKKRLWNNIEIFNNSLETKIIIHGWQSKTTSEIVQRIKVEYLKSRPLNIIAVNWEKIAANYFYCSPARDTVLVGKALAEFIDFLIVKKRANPKYIHIIGHSLGSHVAGNAGSFMKAGKIGRITGLDPAKPGFSNTDDNAYKLDNTDAELVDVIHTSAGFVSFIKPLGDIDFYPNNGRFQPGCPNVVIFAGACSHKKAHEYFAESINTRIGFYAYKCDSWEDFEEKNCDFDDPILMGDWIPWSARGKYYLRTKLSPPYAMGYE